MEKSKDKFIYEKDINHFFSAFGGMGSFSDFLYSETGDLMSVIDVLVSIAYQLASSIRVNKPIEISDVLTKNLDQFKYDNSQEQEDINDLLYKKHNYSKYLLDNYKLGNLHFITQDYVEKLLGNKKIK